MTHTPTPWRVEQGTTHIWGRCDHEDNSSRGMGYPVTECRVIPAGNWAKGPDYDEGEANAAFVVKAVNSHDRLVEALREVADGDWTNTYWVRDMARKALEGL